MSGTRIRRPRTAQPATTGPTTEQATTTQTPTDTTAGTQVWTPEMVRALGVATNLRTAAAIFGVSPSAAYNMVERGVFPVPVIRAGGVYRVPVAAILTALRLAPDDDPSPGPSDG